MYTLLALCLTLLHCLIVLLYVVVFIDSLKRK